MREIPDVEQVPGEPRRRWFFSHEQDLIVWFGADGAPVGFQLAYGKYRHERALRWKAGKGFTHDAVDDGEEKAPRTADVVFEPFVTVWKCRIQPPPGFQARDLPPTVSRS